jgi:thiamine biosynthesis protein ThiS
MNITLNGNAVTVADGATLHDLILQFHLNPAKAAVERNLAIVPRALYAETVLCDGDRIEIVEFVGGG